MRYTHTDNAPLKSLFDGFFAWIKSLGLMVSVMTLACALCVSAGSLAWADEGGDEDASKPQPLEMPDGENAINTHQLPDSSFIYDISVSELYAESKKYNNNTVQIRGEAIGDKIRAELRSSRKWVLLQAAEEDKTDSISVYMTVAAARQIDTFGAYGKTGTMLQVRGTFHEMCAEHEGLADVHADFVSVVSEGVVKENELRLGDFTAGIILCLVGFALLILYSAMRERRR